MSEEEKNLEEIDLLKEAEESEEEIREETPEEEREPLTPEDLKDVRELLNEVRELRGGLRGAADPNMIQKHLDNFLAALCGETPVDSNVRTSTEYWLKRLADGEGGSTKKIYGHTIYFKRQDTGVIYCEGYFIILNNDPTPIDVSAFEALMKTSGFIAVAINGRYGGSTDVTATDSDLVAISYNSDNRFSVTYRSDTTHDKGSNNLAFTGITVTDLGVNAIN